MAAAERLGLDVLDAASNDYLGLAAEHAAAVTADAPAGAGASRLVHGTFEAHTALERDLAQWVGMDSALLFTSAYAANVGLLAAVRSPGDHVVSAKLNHASIIDGIRLARAQVTVVDPDDLGSVASALSAPCAGQRWLVVESYYSMDGTSPDLVALRAAASASGAVFIVDEAHALGVFGSDGAGLCSAAAVQPDVLVGGLGKSLGLQGGFVAGSGLLRTWLWNRARSFVFSTASSPALALAGVARVAKVRAMSEERAALLEIAAEFRARVDALPNAQLQAGAHGPIVSLLFGTPERALAAARTFLELGVLVQAIRPPTVPPGASRLRLALKASFSAADRARLLAAVEAACRLS
jgi:8-amino-7-oxononanoate synthase